MSKNLLDAQLDSLETQVNELSVSLFNADAMAVQAGGAMLQRLAVDLVQMTKGAGWSQLANPGRVQRIKAIAVGMASLRETLLRRIAYVSRALEVVVPVTRDQATYAGGGAYGKPVRQSGAFAVFSA
jgi:hypothetical protein